MSICTTEGDVHYNPYIKPETRVVAMYSVTSTSSPTKIGYNQYISGFSEIEIDGVVQPSVVSEYTFDTVGEHTVKYTLKDPTSIGDNAFNNCTSLTNVVIPNSVTSIGSGAFNGCYKLTSIDIPSGVTSIDTFAFSNCYYAKSITIEAITPPTLGSNALYSTGSCPIYVPSASVEAYESASGWSDYADRIQAIP